MKLLTLLLLTLAPTVLGQFLPDEDSRFTRSFPGFTRSGKSTMEARELVLQGWNWKGRQIKGNLFVLFDPSTKYFLWRYGENEGHPGKIYLADVLAGIARAYATDSSLILIEPPPPGLEIWESSQKASSLDDAEQQAQSTLKAQAHLIPRNGLWPWPPKLVKVPDLSVQFYIPPDYAMPRRAVRVLSISPVANGLEVVIEGEWQERLILSPNYDVLKMERVTPQPDLLTPAPK